MKKRKLLLGFAAMLLLWIAWAQTGVAEETPQNGLGVTLTSDALTNSEAEYSGEYVTVDVSVKFYYMVGKAQESKSLTAESDYDVTYSYQAAGNTSNENIDADKIKNAGTYTVTVTGKNDYEGYSQTAKFTIKQLELDLSGLKAKEGARIQYGTPEDAELKITDFITLTKSNGLVEDEPDEETDALKCLSIKKAVSTGDAVGDAALVKVEAAKESESVNYKYEGKEVYFQVDVDKKVLTLSLEEESKVYDGKTVKVDKLVSGLDFVDDNVKAEYTINKDNKEVQEIKGAGKYTITVGLSGAAKGNYEFNGEPSLTYEITRKVIDIKTNEGAELSKVYDGKVVSKDNVAEFYTIDSTVDGDNIEVTMQPSGATKGEVNAGDGVVTIAPYVNGRQIQSKNWSAPETDWEEAPEALSNYAITIDGRSTSGALPKFTITKRPVLFYFEGGEKTYDGKAVASLEYTVKELKGNDNGFVGEDDGFEIKPVAKFATFKEGVTEAKNADEYDLVEDEDEAENITYKNSSKNYFAQFVKTEDVKVEGATNINVYVIKKAEFTARALNKEVNFATTDEDLETLKADLTEYLKISPSKTGYEGGTTDGKNLVRTSVDGGLVSEMNAIVNQLGETLTIPEKVDLTKVGEYEIGFGVKAEDIFSQNWSITLTPGKLYVKGDNKITLDGDDEPETAITDVLRRYNGATVDEVTVKNLKSLMHAGFKNDGRWYTLVLPFDVTVREISNAFGYAIVNVPDVKNNNPEQIVFKLEMTETIKANTLMAFKVDNTLDSDDDINLATGVTFKKKKIEAPAEEHKWIHDAANNYFIGVYEKKPITGDNQFYLNPKQKDWRAASAMSDSEIGGGNGMMMHAMNGYVEFNEGADLTKVRVLVQEADGSTTSINVVTGETVRNTAEGWYTVGGIKLNGEPTQKGIYINNGKKVVIK